MTICDLTYLDVDLTRAGLDTKALFFLCARRLGQSAGELVRSVAGLESFRPAVPVTMKKTPACVILAVPGQLTVLVPSAGRLTRAVWVHRSPNPARE